MKLVVVWISCALAAIAQQQPPANGAPSPIYQVTVVERTVKAVNYQYRSDPTPIDFRGTVLLPKGKGEALVHSKQGHTEIDAKFEKLADPQQFGVEYLTYVLWALTPDGRPHNIGEVVPGTRQNARLRVTTDMQAFAMIVTAEPYSAVRQPSDVVILENEIRPDTVGKIEQVDAKYELLPRKSYALHLPDHSPAAESNGPKVSMREYEAISQVYQAQNAIEAARAVNADRYASSTFTKAQQLFDQAQQMKTGKSDSSRIVETAREAAEAAEDARVIANKHQQDEKLAQAQADLAQARHDMMQAELEARKARGEAAQARIDSEHSARPLNKVEATTAPPSTPTSRTTTLNQLNVILPSRDTPRGLVVTITDSGFTGTLLTPATADRLARVENILAAHPGMRVEIEAYTDSRDTGGLSQKRADEVRDFLIRRGAQPAAISARGLGNSHPLNSSRTAAGHEENQRVELVISSDPTWTSR